jgi:hypothetical protein
VVDDIMNAPPAGPAARYARLVGGRDGRVFEVRLGAAASARPRRCDGNQAPTILTDDLIASPLFGSSRTSPTLGH